MKDALFNTRLTKKDLMFSPTEYLNPEKIHQAVTVTENIVARTLNLVDREMDLNVLRLIENQSMGGNVLTKTLATHIQEYQPKLLENTHTTQYPDMWSRKHKYDDRYGIELKSLWMGSGSPSLSQVKAAPNTNRILLFSWDWFRGYPRFIEVYFANNLTEKDWNDNMGKKSKSLRLSASGVEKMKNGWLFLNPQYAFDWS